MNEKDFPRVDMAKECKEVEMRCPECKAPINAYALKCWSCKTTFKPNAINHKTEANDE